jgi:hypothetical protein
VSSSPISLIETLGSTLDFALGGRGFTRSERIVAGDAFIERLVRTPGWKRDVVDLVYRRGRSRVFVNLAVEIPAEARVQRAEPGRHVIVDGTNVPFVVGRRDDGYELPRGLFWAWKRRWLIFRIDRDTRIAVDWFNGYDSPRRALQRLRGADRNGCGVGTDVHRATVAFLESLGDEYPSRRELIEAVGREVAARFGPLAERHGLRLREIEPRLFTVESSHVRVRIRFGSGHVPDVDIRIGPASAKPVFYDDIDTDLFGLEVVLQALTGSDNLYDPQPLKTFDDVRREIGMAADLLERFCGRILEGDLSLWTKLRGLR